MGFNASLAFGAYLVFAAVFLFVIMFGESEMFQGTIVERIHYWTTEGWCVALDWGLRKTLGKEKGERVFGVINHWVCERANPFMQLVYLSLVIGGYYVFVAYGFDLIGLYVHPAHAFVLPTVMTLSLMQWLRVCWSDPGVINASNLEAHYRAHPFDGVLYRPKECPTLGVTVPARSKFCNTTKRRVAKFDHYCGWFNNVIGENNLRHFIVFLAVHVALCAYVAYLSTAVVYGEVARRGLLVAEFNTRRGPRRLTEDWLLLSKFLVYHYAPLVMLDIFLVVLVIALGSFLVYHLHLINKGMTTNETFKWKYVRKYMQKQAEEAAAEAASQNTASKIQAQRNEGLDVLDEADVGCVGPTGGEAAVVAKTVKTHRSFWDRLTGRRKPKVTAEEIKNIYNKGLRKNLWEVFHPPSQAVAQEMQEMGSMTSANAGGSKRKKKKER